MKERMQKTSAYANDFPQRDRTESEVYGGVQTFVWMTEDNIVEVPFDREHLLETILSPDNLNEAYKAVVRNKGCGGIDKMSCEQLLPWLLANKDELIRSLLDGSYRPNPVRRVEIPKDNGKMRQLGIPTVVDRMVQQAINQVLTIIYEPQFSKRSFGFRPRRGCLNALREAQKIVDEGYKYVVDLDLERFFDTVSHSKLIEILSRTIKDGRVVSLIHKYLRSGVIDRGLWHASEEGTPQGGPLSPLLSNIMLNELDKELVRRGHPFVRYADDSMGKDGRFIRQGCEIPRLFLLCTQRQVPTHRTSKVQGKDEVTTKRTDKSKQWLGLRKEEAETERVHTRMGRLLSPRQNETSLPRNR